LFSAPLITFSLADDPAPVVALARALAEAAGTLRALVCVEPLGRLALTEADLAAVERALERGEQVLRALAGRLADDAVAVEGEVVVAGLSAELFAAIEAHKHDVVIFGPFGDAARERVAGLALELARTHGAAAAVGAFRPVVAQPRRLVYPFDGRIESLVALGAFVRDRCDVRHTVVLLALGAIDPRLAIDRPVLGEVAGIRAALALETLPGGWLALARNPDAIADAYDADALLLSADVGAGLPDVAVRLALRALCRATRPIVFTPALAAGPPARNGRLDAFDVLCPTAPCPSDEVAEVRLERLGGLGGLGGPAPLADGPLEVIVDGRRVATLASRAGRLQLTRATIGDGSIGLGRPVPQGDPLAAIEAVIFVGGVGGRRVALIDARIEGEALAEVRARLDDGARALFAVRVIPDVPAQELRARWLAAGFRSPRVLDVRDLLDEGDASDVHVALAAVRLCRAAARLRAGGTCVDVVVALDPGTARTDGFALVSPVDLADLAARIEGAYTRPPPDADRLDARLDTTTASRVQHGHRVRVELDNAAARRDLLALVDGAARRVHAQWYIVEDDEVTREVEAGLVRAAARGVEVRVLVDSLYSLHGSFGVENALLRRLGAAPGVELRASRPIQRVPSLIDLKQRDHRKVFVVDGTRSLVSGRNLGKQYYRAFAEAHVHPGTLYADVPWLDASVALDGPAAATLDASFLQAWLAAGGDAFPIVAPPPAGDTAVRVVVHHGLADAYTLEAYLALIEAAERRLLVVNSFPLQLEVQHALMRALARGVRLGVLVGRVRASFGDGIPFVGGGSMRALADTLVRARLATLIEAGADVRELALAPLPGWDARLGLVHPHVHAKLMCADGRTVALGSANLDVTAGYWESEALVLIDDPPLAAGVEAEVDALRLASPRIDPNDAKWRESAAIRAWLGRVWPSVIG
jgi:phosphatidylserine/phosphatidylglycerophosphate/cardiolipin synthase-like enzyme